MHEAGRVMFAIIVISFLKCILKILKMFLKIYLESRRFGERDVNFEMRELLDWFFQYMISCFLS